MAEVYATKSGNWSDATVWNTGALPQATDDVFSNGYTVTINQDVTVRSIRNTASTGIAQGGGFAVASSRTIDCSAGAGFISGVAGVSLVTLTGTYVLTTLGTVTANAGNAFLLVSNTPTVNHTGACTAAGGNCFSGSSNNTIIVNIVGNCAASASAVVLFMNGTVSIVGTVSTSGGNGVYSVGNFWWTVTITGDCSGSNCLYLIGAASGGTATVAGRVTAGTTACLASSGSTVPLRLTGPFISGPTGAFPFIPPVAGVRLSPIVGNELRFAALAGGTTSLYSSDMLTGPAVGDVRAGVGYVYDNVTKEGTLVVPSPAYVSLGVATDNTVGSLIAATAADIAAAVWAAASRTLTAFGFTVAGAKDAVVDTIAGKVAALPEDPADESLLEQAIAAATVDFTPVLEAIATVQASVEDIDVDFTPVLTALADVSAGVAGVPVATDAELTEAHGAGAWGEVVGGSVFEYTVTSSTTGLPIAGVHVAASTDAAGTNVVAAGYTNDFGVVRLLLAPGTWYLWRKLAGYAFTDPDTEVVA